MDHISIIEEGSKSPYTRAINVLVKLRNAPFEYLSRHSNFGKILFSLVLFVLYNAYLIGCIVRKVKSDDTDITTWEWCDGIGFLIIITGIVYVNLFYFNVVKPVLAPRFDKAFSGKISQMNEFKKSHSMVNDLINVAIGLAILAGVLTFLVWDALSKDEPERLVSIAGVVGILFLGFLGSAHPAHIRWRHVFWGIGIQFTLGLITLRWDLGRQVFDCIGGKVTTFLAFTDAGSGMVFGYLVTGKPLNPMAESLNGSEYIPIVEALNSGDVFSMPFMFKTLSIIYFFSFCVSMMFYLGALQWLVLKMGWLLSISVGTTAAESLNAAANIFLGQTEAPLLIKPFLKDMTKSEIHAVMTGGFATIAGTVLGAYINFGIDAAKLIAASVMAAPAALAVSKLFYPETEKTKTSIDEIKLEKGSEANVLDAAAQGASTAIMLVLNIGASLIAFLAFVECINHIIGWMGELGGADIGLDDDGNKIQMSLNYLLGKMFVPIAYLMGVPAEDTENVATLVGIKTAINEFVAFDLLGKWVKENPPRISPRAEVIATYALCGFANPSSIGIQLGGLGAIAPERKDDLARIVLRAFVAGCFTSFLNACVAGAIISSK